MNETSKTKKIWGPLETSTITGSGIDIGCGSDPVTPDVQRFDRGEGDASHITEYVHQQFDFVYSSHCLEHLPDPASALRKWWQLVRPGGHLIFIVPDEDLYEQGVFPSQFNPEHRATFTISKTQSWSPVSLNVQDLAQALPNAEIVSLVLQDHGYDRCLLRHGENAAIGPARRFAFRVYHGLRRRGLFRVPLFERWQSRTTALDQTRRPDVLAQIQCIVRKLA